jgi:hypothetical protein
MFVCVTEFFSYLRQKSLLVLATGGSISIFQILLTTKAAFKVAGLVGRLGRTTSAAVLVLFGDFVA